MPSNVILDLNMGELTAAELHYEGQLTRGLSICKLATIAEKLKIEERSSDGPILRSTVY